LEYTRLLAGETGTKDSWVDVEDFLLMSPPGVPAPQSKLESNLAPYEVGQTATTSSSAIWLSFHLRSVSYV
jgi:hypothetical protein